MQSHRKKYWLGIALIVGVSCSKETTFSGTASLTVVNAVLGSERLVYNFSGMNSLTYYISGGGVSYGSFNELSSYAGTFPMALYEYPDTLVHSAPIFNLSLTLPVNSIYSLFLAGTISQPDTLVVLDNPTYLSNTDSLASIRFVNLSSGSNPISINLIGNSNGSEVSSLSYKGVAGFKSYSATSDVNELTFEIRDAISGDLLLTYSLPDNINAYRFRNITVTLNGIAGISSGTNAFSAFVVNNY